MPIIEVNHVIKEYQLGTMQSLKTTALNQWRRVTGQPVEERAPFKALDDVTFSVEQDKVLGIIGRNSAGKCKVLKLLALTSKSISGTIKLKVALYVAVSCSLTRTKYSEFIDFAEYIRRSSMGYRNRITIEPGKLGGKPCIRGMRMTVYNVLDYLASGITPAEILADFPYLATEDIPASLAYVAARERRQIAVAA